MNAITQKILDTFAHVAAIPRCSGNEKAISKWLRQWASENGFTHETDPVGNVLIRIPATKGYEKAPVVVIQGHCDMVGQKTPESNHDFRTDPIQLVHDGQWLRAHQTTLGADNGVGIALALEFAKDDKVFHPELELLFTVDEEVGMTGAGSLSPEYLRGRILLNIDSEQEGMFTIGCAGGRNTTIMHPLTFTALPDNFRFFTLTAGGMRGGHSGDDINKQRANANKILFRALNRIRASFSIRLISISGGSVHNAIPREAEAIIALDSKHFPAMQQLVEQYQQIARNEYPGETTFSLNIDATDKDASDSFSGPFDYFIQDRLRTGMGQDQTDRVINLILALPNGVARMSGAIQGLVETSNNLAIVKTKDNLLHILSSQRSSVMSRLDELTSQIEATALLAQASVRSGKGYPNWQPNMRSPLLSQCKKVYFECFGEKAGVESAHAGLECGVIGSKFKHMDMISFGPTILDPHSPEERLYIPSVLKVWTFLENLTKSITGPLS